jgi:hypothetical protein
MPPERASQPRSVVWIDSERAVIVRWDGAPQVTRLESDVPRHRRGGSGGEHVTHDPVLRAMGQPTPERHRLEHLRQFLQQVADRIDPHDAVEMIGPGPVHEKLARLLKAADLRQGRSREVAAHAAGLLTEAQLIARVREEAGEAAPRVRARVGGAA